MGNEKLLAQLEYLLEEQLDGATRQEVRAVILPDDIKLATSSNESY
jgi:hypothetical protein